MSSTRSLIILSRDGIVHALATIAGEHGYAATCLNSLIALDDIDLSDAVLISMSSGVIVPRRMIDRLSAAYNFHGATPTYPGRDPHYWALLDGAAEFGCTAHVMLPIVDAGAVVATRTFETDSDMSAEYFRQRSEIMNVGLFECILPKLMDGSIDPTGEQWRGVKRTRDDFVAHGLEFESAQTFEFSNLDPHDRANALHFGIHHQKDPELARILFREALDTGHEIAPFRLAKIALDEGRDQDALALFEWARRSGRAISGGHLSSLKAMFSETFPSKS